MSNSLVVVVDSSLENERKETALAHKFFHLSCCWSGTYKFHEEFPHLIQAKPSEAFESRLIKLSQQVH